ncbi:MAG: DNA replication/repair protein RecF [Candidatus Anoxymicrobium japonicum]|uniref:DNA replication and repair protein RecF n=1 Tax=Candidatus Anoxymicrobium japonicum TaxID=2013648 RepID=A0A2N3G5K5_9ACTN|nr:MAG: DNA replication/repair protein RecF [Candidatus Anoxymicrobium japonicum]
MRLSRLELINFRNYARQEINFSEGRNIVTGRNAQGKSNLLEAIYLLSHLRSNRAMRLRELVKDGEGQAALRGVVNDQGDRINLKMALGPQGRSVELNGRKTGNTTKAAGALKCVLFTPDDLYLVKGDPSRRRNYFDETMEELGPTQADAVRQYRHILRQRNALLRRWEGHGASLESALIPWTEALVSSGAAIIVERLRMLEEISPCLRETYKAISGEEKELEVRYHGTVALSSSEAEVATAMKIALERCAKAEKKMRTTTVGPHRDDVEIRLGGRAARASVSQGEQRTIAFCLRVAQKKYLRERTGKEPVLLLDDVLSELDERRKNKVLELAGAESQAIITATGLPPSNRRSLEKVFVVEDGRVSSVV